MDVRLERLQLAFASATVLALAACGGGGGDDPPAPVAPVAAAPTPTTTSVSTTVVDGAIRNALVCIDKNSNGHCEANETQGRTDASGNVTLAVPNADVGKYPIAAIVGTDAVDADNGPVTTAYTLSAPADQTGIVTPLTTLVRQTIASSGASTADAASSVQQATGITASLFQDMNKLPAPTDGSVNPATVSRMLVVTMQKQAGVIASALGTPALDGSTITQADLDTAIQKKLLEMLPDLVVALADPAVQAAATAADKEAALLAAATTLVASSGLTAAAVPTAVAINTQASTPLVASASPPAPTLNLDALNFTDAANYFVRTLGSSAAQNTPDANNLTRYVERRTRSVDGHVARWGSGSDPWRNADLSWNGSAWVACPINYENRSSVRDAQGNSVYDYCGRETGKTNRATFDIAGKTLAEIYAQIVAAGYTSYFIADPTLLGTATFPADSKLFYQTNTALTEAVSYYPAGANSPAGFSNVVTQYSAAVSAGGTASAQAAGVGCNSTEANTTSGASSTTLEALIAVKTGTPCVYGQGSFTYGGVTFTSGASNEWWGAATVSVGKLGSAPINSGPAPGYYTTNTLLRAAFTGPGVNPVTYYACKERFNNGSIRNCSVIGTGSYTITTLGDGRALILNNPPLQAAALTYNRVFVERGGAVYFGYQGKATVTGKARLNLAATNALLTRLGLPVDDPSAPLALTAGSYQGSWDFREAGTVPSPTKGTSVFINANGSASCQDRETSTFSACTITITDPSTGAFTSVDGSSTATGTLSFAAGTGSGTYHDPTAIPVDGSFVGARR